MFAQEFINYLTSEKRFSHHTLVAYTNDIQHFLDYLNTEYEVSSITQASHQHVRSWMAGLSASGLSARSVNRKLSSLKSFFRYLMKKGLIENNPMSRITAPKMPGRLPVFIPQGNMENLLDESMFSNDFQGIRERVIIETFYHTGIRLSELAGMQLCDLDLVQSHLKVLGKRNKERQIPINPFLADLLKNYIAARDTFFSGKHAEEYVFLNDKGKKLYPKFIYNTVNNCLSRITTVSKKSPHVLRHTFATHMLNNGADINAIKALLGHSSLAATQVYTHNSIEKLKNIYKQAHPKA